MLALGACILIFQCIRGVLGAATSTTHSTATADSNQTCPSRTINYLTHTLPQQCLASTRAGGLSANASNEATITTPVGPPTSTESSDFFVASKSTTHIGNDESSSAVSSSTEDEPLLPSSDVSLYSVTTIVATTAASAVAVPLLPEVVDEDSPLESGNFLSFEDWKKQNLINTGQSEHLGRKGRGDAREPRMRPGNVHNTLDALGDDAEIDLDFSGLVPEGPDKMTDRTQRHVDPEGDISVRDPASALRTRARSKDAGTTCKERFNYASFDCAANVLKSNPEAQNPNLVLRENKDLYMLNKCSANNKFIILELCDDISIDTIVLANFEFFSSSFRTFRVSVSDRYPVKMEKWKTLGTFEARNSREVQAFLVENPIIWARYVRIEFLTQYGTEFYCPVSLVRVHGTTMMDEYKHDLETGVDEDEEEGENAISTESGEEKLVPEAVDELLLQAQQYESAAQIEEAGSSPDAPPSLDCLEFDTSPAAHMMKEDDATTPNRAWTIHQMLLSGQMQVCLLDGRTLNCTYAIRDQSIHRDGSGKKQSVLTAPTFASLGVGTKPATSNANDGATSVTSKHRSASDASNTRRDLHSTKGGMKNSENKKTSTSGTELSQSHLTSKEITRSSTTKQSGSGTQPQPASPTMQESFFKSVQKRLQMLESNSSLSLLYIEEQSRALRDAFRKVEQRQLSKTSTFLEHLNQTVLDELREFRQQYDHLWQSTVIELELQRERYQQESQAMHDRLGVLADELIFQRRVTILQMILILVCLGLILFSRGAISNYLELPMLQNVLARSPNSKWIGLSGDSRAATPVISRTRSAHQLGSKQGILKGHSRGLSEDSQHEQLSGSELFSPPTPVSFDGYSDAELVKIEPKLEEPEFDPILIPRPSTSPPVLPGNEDPSTPKSLSDPEDTSIDGRILTPVSGVDRTNALTVKVEQATPPGRHLTWDLPS